MRAIEIAITVALNFPAIAQASTWIAGVDRYAQPQNPVGASFMELFQPGAHWKDAAADIQIFKISTQFLHQATDGELSSVIRSLNSKHISLGMEGLLLVESQHCGRGVEGYGGQGAVPALAERVKRSGGEIAYVSMDSPVWYGSRAQGPNVCRDDVESLAEQMAPNVKALTTAFPWIRFGTAEPLNVQTAGHIDAVLKFAQSFKSATGKSLSSVHADIIWTQSWKPQLMDWKKKLHAAGIKLGVIFNGDPTDTSDLEWTNKAFERYCQVMSDPTVKPDDIVFQSWMPRPNRLLPDSDPSTLTGLVKRTETGSLGC
jgi:hypothetical protein